MPCTWMLAGLAKRTPYFPVLTFGTFVQPCLWIREMVGLEVEPWLQTFLLLDRFAGIA